MTGDISSLRTHRWLASYGESREGALITTTTKNTYVFEEWGVFLCYTTHRTQLNIPDDCLLEEKRRSSTLENKHKGKSVLITSRNGRMAHASVNLQAKMVQKNEVEILK